MASVMWQYHMATMAVFHGQILNNLTYTLCLLLWFLIFGFWFWFSLVFYFVLRFSASPLFFSNSNTLILCNSYGKNIIEVLSNSSTTLHPLRVLASSKSEICLFCFSTFQSRVCTMHSWPSCRHVRHLFTCPQYVCSKPYSSISLGTT